MRISERTYIALLRVGFALVIAAVISQFRFDYVEALFYDARVRLRPTPEITGKSELVVVDPKTVEHFGRVPSAKDHLRLIERLKDSGAAAVVYLINPNELTGTPSELKKLAAAINKVSRFYVAVDDVALKGEENAFKLLPPFEKVAVRSSPLTSDRNIFAGDAVTRRMFLSYQGQAALQPELAALFNPGASDEKKVRGVFEYLGSNQLYIDFHPTNTYPITDFVSVLDPSFNLERFTGKIVFVGRDIQTTSRDYVRTPYSRDIVAMTVLELHANMLDTLIRNSAPIRVPKWIDLIVTALISILTVYVVLSVTPSKGLLILAGTLIGYFVFGFFLFWLAGLWIGIAHPFLAVFVCYYFFIPYRLIIENRRSWEYYQKNKLLMQVEELKTNFISMMSHDLKTPIARIQGMTDVVLKDPNPLSKRQKEALENLSKSSQELLTFISSILNLGRIEGQNIELNYASRDVNSLLLEVIAKLDYLAKPKNIKIVTELEPMFSIRMDADLMRQVFSNLIENAIKYSPDNSRILVTTEEVDGRVVIQVADQGIGIPEADLPHVFAKFYRSRAAKSSTIKGSGLGLYLAKYFVELHSGTISVDSRYGAGSTFTVELPTETVTEPLAQFH